MAEVAPDIVTTGFAIAWPWLLLLLPLPWGLRRLLPEAPARDMQAVRVPWYQHVVGAGHGWLKRPVLAFAASLVWLLLVFAASRPQWIGEVSTLPEAVLNNQPDPGFSESCLLFFSAAVATTAASTQVMRRRQPSKTTAPKTTSPRMISRSSRLGC